MDLSEDRGKSAWVLKKKVKGSFTYPKFTYSQNGTIFLFLRDFSSFSFFSYESGEWSSKPKVVKLGDKDKYIYPTKPYQQGNKIYFAFSILSQATKLRKELYVAEINNGSVKLYDLSVIHPFNNAWPLDIKVDSLGNVGILVTERLNGTFNDGGESVIYEVSWNIKSGNHKIKKIKQTHHHYYPSISAYLSQNNVVYEQVDGLSGVVGCNRKGSFRPSFVYESDSYLFLTNNKPYRIRDYSTNLYLCIRNNIK